METRPLFGRSPLFGVSVKREFTVIINISLLWDSVKFTYYNYNYIYNYFMSLFLCVFTVR